MLHEPENPDPEGRNPDERQLDGVSGGGLAGLSRKVERYGRAKSLALDVADFIRSHTDAQALRLERVADRVQACGDYLLFRHYHTVDEVKLHAARLCGYHLLCPLCAIRRASKMLAAYQPRLTAILAHKPHLQPYLVTLTVKDGPDLVERFKHLHDTHQRLWRRRHKHHQRSSLRCIDSAVWSYEIKRGAGSGLWHPHLHMYALAGTMPDAQALSAEWYMLTGDSYIVDVRPISQDDPISGFAEVFKYALKFGDMDPPDILHAYRVLRNKRLIASAGGFRGIDEPSSLLDDRDLEDLPYFSLLFTYLSQSRRYMLASRQHPGCA